MRAYKSSSRLTPEQAVLLAIVVRAIKDAKRRGKKAEDAQAFLEAENIAWNNADVNQYIRSW